MLFWESQMDFQQIGKVDREGEDGREELMMFLERNYLVEAAANDKVRRVRIKPSDTWLLRSPH
jgi:hypothetical protein